MVFGILLGKLSFNLEEDEVFHIHLGSLDDITDNSIKQSSNPSAWKMSSLEKRSTLRQLDICFNEVDAFIETMRYSYNKMKSLHWVHTNKMIFKKSKSVGNGKQCQENNKSFV